MRSDRPKVLHPLCGRPMIEWPIAAAREAGAGRVVVVDGPKRRARRRAARRRRGRDPGGAERDRRRRALRRRPHRRRRHRARALRRRAADHRRGDHRARARRTRRAAPPPRWRRWSSRTRRGYGRVVRALRRQRRARGRDEDARRRDPGGGGDPRGQHRHLRVRRRRPRSTRCGRLDLRQRPGRALPARRAAAPARRRQGVAAHVVTDPTLTLGVNTRVDLATRPRARPGRASTDAHALAGVTIVDPRRR